MIFRINTVHNMTTVYCCSLSFKMINSLKQYEHGINRTCIKSCVDLHCINGDVISVISLGA